MIRTHIAALTLICAAAGYAEHATERLQEAQEIFTEIMSIPDKAIPQDLLDKAHCIVIVPGLKSGAIGIGGKYGRGFATCRKSTNQGWGAPAAVRVEGGSFGFQIGGSSTDVVMLVMNERGMNRLLESKFTLGGNASVAAGPVGRTASANTDAFMSAEILSWSRSRGLFAGVALEGATLRNDVDENAELYGERLHNKDILLTDRKPPASAASFITALNKYSRHEEGRAVSPAPSRGQRSRTKQK
jgi:SH3 domain-containing YSC84-like protein 1